MSTPQRPEQHGEAVPDHYPGYPPHGQLGPPHGGLYGHPDAGDYARAGMQPQGAPGYPLPPQLPERTRRQKDSQPGRFTWWDLGATIAYGVLFFGGLIGLVVLFPPFSTMINSGDDIQEQRALFGINAVGYVIFAVIGLALGGAALWRSIKAFKYLWWLKLLLIPVGWLATLIVTAVITGLLTGFEPVQSENQIGIEMMLEAVPFLAAILVLGVAGPFVEEFFFRHLLVGKLSRYLNVWICGIISITIFPLIHFIPALLGMADDLSLASVAPYFVMGTLFTVGYIVTGRNLFYATLLHAFNNSMSVVMLYFVQPWAEEMAPMGEPMSPVITAGRAFGLL